MNEASQCNVDDINKVSKTKIIELIDQFNMKNTMWTCNFLQSNLCLTRNMIWSQSVDAELFVPKYNQIKLLTQYYLL